MMKHTRLSLSSSARARLIAAVFLGALTLMTNHSLAADAAQVRNAGPTDAEGFSFLDGHWRVHHKRLKTPLSGREEWAEFEGRAAFFSLLDGLVSVEELRDAEGAPFGSAMRTFDRERRVWSDAWVSASSGVLQAPVYGRFDGDVGSFVSKENFQGQPILSRGVWRRVSKNEATWEQAFSRDDGKTWETNWLMRFERVSE